MPRSHAVVFVLFMVVLTCTIPPGEGLGAEEAWEAPRTPWGTPDLDGVWDFRNLTPFERPPELAGKAVLTPEEARAYRESRLERLDFDRRVDASEVDVEGAYNSFWWDFGDRLTGDLRTSLIVDPEDGLLPALTPEATARLEKQAKDRTPPVRDLFSYGATAVDYLPSGPEALGLSERCLVGFNAGPPMRPSAYNNNVRILQTEDHVLLVNEMIHDARVVRLDGGPHLPDSIERWMGDSRGRWEGDTLVVETRSFTSKKATFQMPAREVGDTEYPRGAVGTGRDLHLTERFTRVAADRLEYEYTVEAPGVFERPFTVSFPMHRSEERMYEYACHEGNYAMPGMLKGARVLEQEAGASASSP